jgi:hypothetical protein
MRPLGVYLLSQVILRHKHQKTRVVARCNSVQNKRAIQSPKISRIQTSKISRTEPCTVSTQSTSWEDKMELALQ